MLNVNEDNHVPPLRRRPYWITIRVVVVCILFVAAFWFFGVTCIFIPEAENDQQQRLQQIEVDERAWAESQQRAKAEAKAQAKAQAKLAKKAKSEERTDIIRTICENLGQSSNVSVEVTA